jgi:plasmid stabilization system protein ParE
MSTTSTALIWSEAARNDIARLYEFLKNENPNAAKLAIKSIKHGANSLADFPALGKRLEGRNDREIFVPFGKRGYIIRYRLDGITPIILRIWHGFENKEN